MDNLLIKSENFDNNRTDKEIFDDFNSKLRNYRQLADKQEIDKETIVNELILIIEKLGIDKFIIYNDGDVEYIWK